MSLPLDAKVQPATSATPQAELEFLHGPLPAALARDDFTNLAVLLRHARDGCWAFALYNSVAVREQVVAALKTLVAPLPVYQWTYLPTAPYPSDYLEKLSLAEQAARGVVMFFDFERANDTIWKSLDYNRELYADQPHGLVFWVTPPVRGVAARKAPHFWAQRSGVFDFTVKPEQRPTPSEWTSSREITTNDYGAMQQQLRMYRGLLDELGEGDATPQHYLANLHYKIARLAYYIDQLDLARSHATTALQLAELVDDQTIRGDALKNLGDLALREADLGEARRRYEAALAVYPAIGDRLGEANVQQALGDLALREDDLGEARRRYEAALAVYPAIGARLGEANVQQALGDLAFREADLGEARRRYEAALAVYPAIGARLGEANVQKALGDLALREADLGEARRRYEAALAVYPAIGARLGEANVQQALGDLALREADLGEARRRYEAALAVYPAIGDRLGEANVQQALGDLALREDDLGEARRRYEAALAVYPAIGARLGEANVQKALGDLALREADLGEARRRYEAALAVYPAIGDRLGEANVQQALGDLALREADLGEARRRYEAALAVYPAIGDRLGEANVQQALGDLAFREDDRELAATLAHKSLAQFQQIGSILGAANAYVLLGQATDDGQFFEQALEIHTRIPDIFSEARDAYLYGLSQNRVNAPAKAAELFTRARDLWRGIDLEVYAQLAQNQLDTLTAAAAENANPAPTE